MIEAIGQKTYSLATKAQELVLKCTRICIAVGVGILVIAPILNETILNETRY